MSSFFQPISAQYNFKTYSNIDGLKGYNKYNLLQDSLDRLWVITVEGIHLFDGKRFRRIKITDQNDVLTKQKVTWSFIDQDDNLIIGTTKKVFAFNPYTFHQETYLHQLTYKGYLHKDYLYYAVDTILYARSLSTNSVQDSFFFESGVGFDGKYYILNFRKNKYITLHKGVIIDSSNIPPTKIIDDFFQKNPYLAEDPQGNKLFIDNSTKKLFYEKDSLIISYSDLKINGVLKTFSFRPNQFWIWSYEGITYIEFTGAPIVEIKTPDLFSCRTIFNVNDQLYVSAEQGTYALMHDSLTEIKNLGTALDYAHDTLRNQSYIALASYYLKVLDDNLNTTQQLQNTIQVEANKTNKIISFRNYYLVATLNGLYEFDPDSYESRQINLPGLDKVGVYSMHVIDKDHVLIGTEEGLYLYNFKDLSILPIADYYKVPIYNIQWIDEEYWICTSEGGLLRLDNRLQLIQAIDESNGLSDNECYAVGKLDSSNILVTTRDGMTVINYDQLSHYSFNKDQGLDFNEFNRSAFYESPDGYIYAGGVGGLIKFKKEDLNPIDAEGRTATTSINVKQDNKTIKSFIGQKAVHMNEGEVLEITATYPSFILPEESEFKYKVNNEEYIYTSNVNKIIITDLNEGWNEVLINGKGNNTFWDEKGIALDIYFTPFFYKSNLAKILGIILTLVLPFFVYRRIVQAEKQKSERLKIQKELIWENIEQEKKKIASHLHDSVGQQLVMIKSNQDIHNNISLTKEVDDILQQIRRVSSDIYPNELRTLGLNGALQSMVNKLNKKTDIFFSADINELENNLDEKEQLLIFRIIQELFTNTVKHSGASSAIAKFDTNNNTLVIRDNGIGIGDHINQGIGMSSLEDKVNVLGGNYKLINDKGLKVEIDLSKCDFNSK